MKKLKTDFVYQFTGLGIFENSNEIVLVTRTFSESDMFQGCSIYSERSWDMSLEFISNSWDIKEIGSKDEYPEYFL